MRTPPGSRELATTSANMLTVPLGTMDDCGFSPFCGDTSTTGDVACAKIRARVLGTALASEQLGIG